MSEIIDIVGRKIMDSRGNPTVEIEIYTEDGIGIAAAPSGASTGEREVKPFPDMGVDESLRLLESEIASELIGCDVLYQSDIDFYLHEIDGTSNFSRIGGNLSVAISMACAKAGAAELGLPLYRYLGGVFSGSMPFPFANVIGGGSHAIGGTEFQEFLIIPFSKRASENVFTAGKIHGIVKKLISEKFPGKSLGKGDEGAWVFSGTNEEAIVLIQKAIDTFNEQNTTKVRIGLDVAASEFFSGGMYHYKDRKLTPEEQVSYIESIIKDYGLHSVEDPLDQNDFSGYSELTSRIGKKCLIIGDDLFTTDVKTLEKGIRTGAANAILIKPNQIGTLTDTHLTVTKAHKNGYETIISHRSGETSDSTISHIAAAYGSHGLKCGAVGGERTAKLNELIRIEEELI